VTASTLVEPAYANYPAFTETLGPEVADLCELAGYGPDPEQRMALDVLFALGEDRWHPAVFEMAVVCARQNLKTAFLKQAALGFIYVGGAELVMWSAHEMDTARAAFRDLVSLIENCPPLARRLADGPTHGIHRGNGNECIEFAPSPECPRGQRIMFKARTKTGGLGLSGDKVILDEAFALQDEHIAVLMPILSTRPEAQLVYASSACREDSDVLRRIVERGRSGNREARGRLGYLEWCAPEDACEDAKCPHYPGYPGCAMDKREFLQMANPAAGRRISWEYLADERRSMPPEKFGRERLGWHDRPALGDAPLISRDMWRALVDPDSTPLDPVSFGVYVNRSQTYSAIGVAGYRADGLFHVGVVPAVRGDDNALSLPGIGWIPDRVKELVDSWGPCAVVIDERSEAGSLITDLQGLGVDVQTTNAAAMAQACGRFFAAVRDREIRHQGSRPLEDAVCSAKRRDLGDAWAWDRRDPDSDITQLVAVTLALHGLMVHGRPRETEVWAFWA